MSRRDQLKSKSNAVCLNCGESFYRWPFEIRNGTGNCCCDKCSREYKKKKLQESKIPNTVCAICGKEFYRAPKRKKSKSGLYFCSADCQNEAYRKHIVIPGPKSGFIKTDKYDMLFGKDRNKILNSRRKHSLNRLCKNCGILIFDGNKSGYCVKCAPRFRYQNITKEQRDKMSENSKKLMREGKIKSWQSRNIMSYPEKFFKKVLDLNHIKYDGINYTIKQKDLGVPNCYPSSCYFLDFKIGMIDLEIDGKQHQYKDRQESDRIRDEYLTKAGYTVYRIKWKNINTPEGKQYIKEEIRKFLEFLKDF